jgi:hypothetical protein
VEASRRRFLQTGVLFGAAATFTWQFWGRRPSDVATKDTPQALPPSRYATLVAAFDIFLDSPRAGRVAARELDAFLATDGADQVAELALALGVLEFAPGGVGDTRRFSRLPRDEARDLLEAWASSSLGVRRQIHSALRKAARFIWFDRPEAWGDLGYDGPWVKG